MTAAFVGSNPATPAKTEKVPFGAFFVLVKILINGFEPVKVFALRKQSSGLFLAKRREAFMPSV